MQGYSQNLFFNHMTVSNGSWDGWVPLPNTSLPSGVCPTTGLAPAAIVVPGASPSTPEIQLTTLANGVIVSNHYAHQPGVVVAGSMLSCACGGPYEGCCNVIDGQSSSMACPGGGICYPTSGPMDGSNFCQFIY